MIVLGIETSCDETACALVTADRRVLSHMVSSQLSTHTKFGGVVPEMAARVHLDILTPLVTCCFEEAKIKPSEISAIAATAGPGLIGGVMVGVSFAKALSLSLDKPFIAINHLEAHALTVRLIEDVPFPYLLLLVSGGHCQILVVENVGHYRQLGTTLDDAVGEAFDKVAKLLGLGYPGGPALEQLAQKGNPLRFNLPKPLYHKAGCDFSFSGLKTAVRLLIESLSPLTETDAADIAASFQDTVCQILIKRLDRAILSCRANNVAIQHCVIAGGVAANLMIRQRLSNLVLTHDMALVAPPISLCTDNGAMVAWAGVEYLRLGRTSDLSTPSRPRWPLSSLHQPGEII